MNPLLRKLRHGYVLKRVLMERLTEPLHLNVLAAFVAAFGSFRARVAFDLVLRAQHAYALLNAADRAKALGVAEVTVVEFGVAAGAGLLNLCAIAGQVTRETGVRFRIVGFDTGVGMPPALDYRDHPDIYGAGDFPMNASALRSQLPPHAELVLGPLEATVPAYLRRLNPEAPIAFVSLDVDYYSSSRDALAILAATDPRHYLPLVEIYLDDIEFSVHNSRQGMLLAVEEFNAQSPDRVIEPFAFLQTRRVFQRAPWIRHMRQLHVLDHPVRHHAPVRERHVLENPYLAPSPPRAGVGSGQGV